MKNNKGFTLVELMVVIVIVGILAAVAIPKFIAASHKARASEFPTVLTSIYTSEESYNAENGTYGTLAQLTTAGLTIPASRYFTYTVGNVAVATFTGTATVSTAFGNATTTDNATINQAGAKTATANLSAYCPNW